MCRSRFDYEQYGRFEVKREYLYRHSELKSMLMHSMNTIPIHGDTVSALIIRKAIDYGLECASIDRMPEKLRPQNAEAILLCMCSNRMAACAQLVFLMVMCLFLN